MPPLRRVLRAPAEVRRGRSEAHRHEHVGVARVLRATKQTGTDLVRQAHLDGVPSGMRVQDLDEVMPVEPDGDRIPGIGDLEILARLAQIGVARRQLEDRKSTRLNSSHLGISYAVFCLKKK